MYKMFILFEIHTFESECFLLTIFSKNVDLFKEFYNKVIIQLLDLKLHETNNCFYLWIS
jgi:hypothetical protein